MQTIIKYRTPLCSIAINSLSADETYGAGVVITKVRMSTRQPYPAARMVSAMGHLATRSMTQGFRAQSRSIVDMYRIALYLHLSSLLPVRAWLDSRLNVAMSTISGTIKSKMCCIDTSAATSVLLRRAASDLAQLTYLLLRTECNNSQQQEPASGSGFMA